MAKQIETLSELDLPNDFWLSIRHISSFKNKSDYDKYLEIKIKEWQQQ